VGLAHGATPDRGFFAVWDGWGIPMPTFLFTDDTPAEDRKRARDAQSVTWEADVINPLPGSP
jgi:hypothetical protein